MKRTSEMQPTEHTCPKAKRCARYRPRKKTCDRDLWPSVDFLCFEGMTRSEYKRLRRSIKRD